MRNVLLCSTLAACAMATTANAAISMSFADPIPGRQLHNQANGGGAGVGLLTYDTTASFPFLFDGSGESLPNHIFTSSYMQLEMTLGVSTNFQGATIAPVSGFFRIYSGSINPSNLIVSGIASAGAFVRISNTNALLFSDPAFFYTPGPALTAITGPITFADPSEAVFTLTSILTASGGSFINPDGSFASFDANASFSGNTLIPAPGALGLAAMGCILAVRRRRA